MNATIPESPETIEAQLDWLREGKRKAVLLTPGCVLPELPLYVDCVPTHLGLIIFNCRKVTRIEILAHVNRDTVGELLGYGVDGKLAEDAPPVVVVRDRNGHEKQAVVAGESRLKDAVQAAEAVKSPGDRVSIEDGQQVLDDRLRSLDARELKIRRFQPETDSLALALAAKSDAHAPLHPTHVILRGDDIIGYYGLNSLPLYRLWFHSEKMKATDSLRVLWHIEQGYREAGLGLIGTLININSPFYPCAVRGGYRECTGDRLFLKGLN